MINECKKAGGRRGEGGLQSAKLSTEHLNFIFGQDKSGLPSIPKNCIAGARKILFEFNSRRWWGRWYLSRGDTAALKHMAIVPGAVLLYQGRIMST
jgi:hypothetical protein